MKHILNDLSQVERNSILEQHSGGKKINTSKFRKLMESKLGNVKPLSEGWSDDDPIMDKYGEAMRYLDTDTGFQNVHYPGIFQLDIRKIKDCDKNKVFIDYSNGQVMVSYCNFEGETSKQELDDKNDPLWVELSSRIKEKYKEFNDKKFKGVGYDY